jgi:hypothetical protein
MSGFKHPLALFGQGEVVAVIDLGWGEAIEPGVAVFLVVPGHKAAQEGTCVLRVLGASRVLGLVFERLEMALAVGIVIAHPWARTSGLNAEAVEQLVEGDCGHRGTTVVVQRELAWRDAQALDGLSGRGLAARQPRALGAGTGALPHRGLAHLRSGHPGPKVLWAVMQKLIDCVDSIQSLREALDLELTYG